jgi:serine/threonine protein kinase
MSADNDVGVLQAVGDATGITWAIKLGSGSYGSVYLGHHPGMGGKLAGKVLRGARGDFPAQALRESAVMHGLRDCPRLLQLRGTACTDRGDVVLVTPAYDYSLRDFMVLNDSLPLPVVKWVFAESARALHELHR